MLPFTSFSYVLLRLTQRHRQLSSAPAGITNQDYIDAMTIFEGYEKDAFVIDRYADSALQAAIQTWNTQCKENGDIFLIFVTGVNNSETLDDANQRSNDYNDYLVNNLFLGYSDLQWCDL